MLKQKKIKTQTEKHSKTLKPKRNENKLGPNRATKTKNKNIIKTYIVNQKEQKSDHNVNKIK